VAEVAVPDIGDFTDVPVVEILVAVGDTVAAEDPLVALESDKATMEVPSPQAGTVKEIHVSVGDTVSEGDRLLTLDDAEGGGDAEVVEPEGGDVEEKDDSGVDVDQEGSQPAESTSEPAASGSSASEDDDGDDGDAGADGEVYASPVVRRLARELGVDLATVQGTGRGGRIARGDIEEAAAGGQKGAPADSGAARSAPAPRKRPEPAEGDERVEMTRIQQLGAANLAGAWAEIPHVTHHEDADVTDLEAFRKTLNAEQQDVKVTMVALLLKASAATLREFPRFASQLDGDHVIHKRDLHIGFAADTPNGLVVPVVRDVDRKGLYEIASELTDLSGKARAGKLSPREMSGAVFTISSLGGIGGTGFTPIINPPQVAILGAVRTVMRPVWDGEAFQPRLVLPLSLSYDHRVIDGAAAARFCVHLANVLADLRRVLL
jgi:pyruvate dehydrogenase E2 component (dihydrolipoamide acetyltransferase)